MDENPGGSGDAGELRALRRGTIYGGGMELSGSGSPVRYEKRAARNRNGIINNSQNSSARPLISKSVTSMENTFMDKKKKELKAAE